MRTHDTPASSLTELELGLAVEESLYDLFRSFARLPRAEREDRWGYSVHHAFPTSPMFKGVWGLRLAPHELDQALDAALAWLQARDAPFAFVWAGPGTEAPDLGARLSARGLELWEQDAPGQAAELDALDWDALHRVPDGFAAERVRDDDGLAEWAATFTAGFEVPAWAGEAWVDATKAFGIGDAPWALYLGRLGGAPVATNILFCGAGVATVLGIGTVVEARGQGIGAAITLAGLADARTAGYRYAVLFATESGARVYRRIGFRDTGSGITRWLWRPGPAA
ncbi:MAG TPA: GNAT family N-acetyltransferase [Gaiella sp.]